MVQGDAAKRAREMASAVASVYQAEGYTPDSGRMEQFHSAAFSQAYEFIPDSALSTVISLTEAEGLPLLAAIDGQQFYKLFFGEFEFESSDTPLTVCEMTKVKPEVGYVKACRLVEFTEHVTLEDPAAKVGGLPSAFLN